MKLNIKKAVSLLLCAMLSVGIYAYLCIIVTPKDINDSLGALYYRGVGFLAEPRNSLDVIVFGNSGVYSGFCPAVLYEKYGMTSYASGKARQTMLNIDKLLKQALKNQRPKTVILETDCFFDKSDCHLDYFGTVFAPFVYHSRWKEIKARDFYRLPNKKLGVDISKGYMNSNHVYEEPLDGAYMGTPDISPADIPAENIKYIKKFVGYCRHSGVRVLFCELPNVASWQYAKHNAVKALAEETGVPFIDMNVSPTGFSLDLKSDFRDKGEHLNSGGARKTTEYIGEFIEENYGKAAVNSHNALIRSEWEQVLDNYRGELEKLS